MYLDSPYKTNIEPERSLKLISFNLYYFIYRRMKNRLKWKSASVDVTVHNYAKFCKRELIKILCFN